jgi:hypothetical protein
MIHTTTTATISAAMTQFMTIAHIVANACSTDEERRRMRRAPDSGAAPRALMPDFVHPELPNSFAAPLLRLLIRRRYGLGYDLAGSSREVIAIDGRNPGRFALRRRWGSILLVPRFSGGGFFVTLSECRNWETVPSQGGA